MKNSPQAKSPIPQLQGIPLTPECYLENPGSIISIDSNITDNSIRKVINV